MNSIPVFLVRLIPVIIAGVLQLTGIFLVFCYFLMSNLGVEKFVLISPWPAIVMTLLLDAAINIFKEVVE